MLTIPYRVWLSVFTLLYIYIIKGHFIWFIIAKTYIACFPANSKISPVVQIENFHLYWIIRVLKIYLEVLDIFRIAPTIIYSHKLILLDTLFLEKFKRISFDTYIFHISQFSLINNKNDSHNSNAFSLCLL